MRYLLSIVGILAAIAMLKYRQQVGDMVGQPSWAEKLGGIYNVVIIVAVLLLFWSIAALTGTETILFQPILWILPGSRQASDTFMVQ